MSQFKFKGGILKNYFPQYFKDEDTYKDEQGRGILERFLDVCGEYFDNDVVSPIENLSKQIDIDQADTLFLNYWWEYFGELPLAWGILTNGIAHWEPQYNNTIKWINTIKNYPKADSRKALRYIISLYKIRGTSLFYEVLGRIYGIRINLARIPCWVCEDSPNPPESSRLRSGAPIADPVALIKATKEDTADFFSTRAGAGGEYDQVGAAFPVGDVPTGGCDDCICYSLDIGIPSDIWSKLSAQEGWEEKGKEYVLNTFVAIVEKYLPISAYVCSNTRSIYPWSTSLSVDSPPLIVTTGDTVTTDTTKLNKGNSSGNTILLDSVSLPQNLIIPKGQQLRIDATILPPNADFAVTQWLYAEVINNLSGTVIQKPAGDYSIRIVEKGFTHIILEAIKEMKLNEEGQLTFHVKMMDSPLGKSATTTIHVPLDGFPVEPPITS